MSRRKEYNSASSEEEDESRTRKRRRVTETIDIEKRLESLIVKVGEKSTSSLESNLEGLASVLEADLQNYRQKILKILCDCVVSMPEKLTIYTTLIGLMNARNYNAGGEFVDVLVRMLKELLKTNQFHDAQITVRFLADLVNCRVITINSLMALFNSFTDVTLEDSIPQVRSDWYVYMVLAALPWVGRELYEKKSSDLDRMLQIIDNYMSKRQKIHIGALRVWSSDDPHPQEEYLECLWAQLHSLRGTSWLERHISRPYLAFDSQLSEALQHALPQIMIPSHHKDIIYPLPSVVFRMFDYTDVPAESGTLPGSHAIERYLVEDHLHRIIKSNFRERKDCASLLLAFPNKNKLPLVYMIVEVVFGQMFHLPRSPHIDIFYASLFIELCKMQPGSVPQVLAQASEMIFDRLDTMNTSCIERFVQWFSHHISNFLFRWSWDDWSSCIATNKELPKPKFIREVLVRCMRLSYYQKIQEICPASYESVLPKKPVATFKFEQEGSGSLPGTMAAHKLLQAIKAKCTPEEAQVLMRDLANPLKDDEGSDARYNPLKIDVFVQTLLFVGSKSFSHSCSAIARYLDMLRTLADGPDAQVCLLKSLHELWKNNQQMIVVLVDKLVRTQIVDCPAVVNWLFSPEMASQFTSFYVWEMLHSTIRKMNKQVTSQQVMLEEAKDRLEAAKRKLKGDYEDEDVEMEDAPPTEEEIERMEEKLEETQSEHKNLFLVIFQRFIILLTDHLAKCEADETDFNTPWYKWVIERLQQVFLQHHEQVYHYTNTLERLMFTSDIDPHILEVFQQFCALRS